MSRDGFFSNLRRRLLFVSVLFFQLLLFWCFEPFSCRCCALKSRTAAQRTMQHPLRRRLALAPSVVGVSHPVFTTCPHCSDDIPDRSRDMDIVRANRGIPVSHWPAQCQCRFGGQGTQIIAVPAGKNPLSPDFLRESMCMLPVQQQCGNGQYRVFDISGHKVIRCTCVNLSEGVCVCVHVAGCVCSWGLFGFMLVCEHVRSHVSLMFCSL
jgi:hypothetical protein